MTKPTAADIFSTFMAFPPPQPRPQPQPPQGAFGGGMLVDGPGTGRSDDVPASMDEPGDTRLSRGEYVIPADVVSAMGDGSTDAGAEALNGLVEQTRAKWQDKVGRIPGPGGK